MASGRSIDAADGQGAHRATRQQERRQAAATPPCGAPGNSAVTSSTTVIKTKPTAARLAPVLVSGSAISCPCRLCRHTHTRTAENGRQSRMGHRPRDATLSDTLSEIMVAPIGRPLTCRPAPSTLSCARSAAVHAADDTFCNAEGIEQPTTTTGAKSCADHSLSPLVLLVSPAPSAPRGHAPPPCQSSMASPLNASPSRCNIAIIAATGGMPAPIAGVGARFAFAAA